MDHSEAIEGKFTERYLLGELSPAQRDQFEDHYFDCAVCADDVEAGAVFIDNARALLREGPVSEEAAVSHQQGAFARYGLPFQAAAWAFVLLLCVTGYENVVTIPKLKANTGGVRAPEILPVVSLVGMGSRAASNPVDAPAAKDFVVDMEIPGGPEFSGYLCELRDATGALKFNLPVSTGQAKDTVRLAVPGTALTPGAYNLVIMGEKTGSGSQNLVQYPLRIH